MRRYLVLCAALLAAGCSRGGIVPVSGKIIIDGKPTGNVHVSFEPIGSKDNPNPGPGSVGVTDEGGVYRLHTIWPQKDGAVVGTHHVKVNLQGVAGDVPPGTKALFARQLPPRYNEKTTLTYDVPEGGTEKADFELTFK
jgi:hypothetical protein